MSDPLPGPGAASFLQLIELEPAGTDVFSSTVGGAADPNNAPAAYGGQVAAQALRAAGMTLSRGWCPVSLHISFIRPGRHADLVEVAVTRDHDGRSYAARRIEVRQHGAVICTASARFTSVRPVGWASQESEMPDVAEPDDAAPFRPGRLLSIDGRDPGRAHVRWERPARFWARCSDVLPPDPLVHACALTYVSDVAPGSPSAPDLQSSPRASLDHAIWFHRDFEIDQWHLIDMVHDVTALGRTYFRGSVYDQAGVIVASIAKEELFY